MLKNKEPKPEIKMKDYNESVFVSTTGHMEAITLISQGQTSLTRIGDQITLDKIEYRFFLLYGDTTNLVRFVLFQWNDSVPPVLTDIFQDPVTYPVSTQYNRDNQGSKVLKILKDETFILNSTSQPLKTSNWVLNFKKKIIFESGTTTGVGHIYYAFVSDSTSGINGEPKITINTRVSYVDG